MTGYLLPTRFGSKWGPPGGGPTGGMGAVGSRFGMIGQGGPRGGLGGLDGNGTTYSVWNSSKNLYDYYRVSGNLRDGVFAPKPPMRGGSHLGMAPEDAARRLPLGAKYVGSGHSAKGLIASKSIGLGSLSDILPTSSPLTFAILGVGAYFAWKAVR